MLKQHVELVEREERQDLSWWKIKKWSLKILNRLFERLFIFSHNFYLNNLKFFFFF
jgi:hypothetical protein